MIAACIRWTLTLLLAYAAAFRGGWWIFATVVLLAINGELTVLLSKKALRLLDELDRYVRGRL